MPNIALTSRCDRACKGCFARSVLNNPPLGLLSRETYLQTLTLLKRSRAQEVRLLGGEPTTHPDFVEFAELALNHVGKLVVFSQGYMPPSALEWLEQRSPEQATVVVNLTGALGDSLESTLREILVRLGPRAQIGVNLSNRMEPLERLLEWTSAYGLRRRVRLGLTHPAADLSNEWLLQRHYRAVGDRLEAFAQDAYQAKVSLELDCGFVPCMFSGGRLPGIARNSTLGQQCGPALDLLPDGRFISCFSLARLGGAIIPGPDQNLESLSAEFSRRLVSLREVGIFAYCSTCSWKRSGECTGGCLGLAATRLRGA